MKITFYSTGCVNCNILAQMLNNKKIEYETCNDVEIMQSKGLMSAPALEVDGVMMTYKKAVEWLKNLEV